MATWEEINFMNNGGTISYNKESTKLSNAGKFIDIPLASYGENDEIYNYYLKILGDAELTPSPVSLQPLTNEEYAIILESLLKLYGKVEILTDRDSELAWELIQIRDRMKEEK